MAGVVASKVRKQRANLQELSKAAGIPTTQHPMGVKGGGGSGGVLLFLKGYTLPHLHILVTHLKPSEIFFQVD